MGNVLDIQTTTRMELIDITDKVRAAVRDSGVKEGHLVLGTWQSIFFVELDGPRNRSINIKIIES